jgi:hypothetical protein
MSNVNLEKTLDVNMMMFDESTQRIEIMQCKILFTMITLAPDDSAESISEARINHSINFAKCLTFLELMLDHAIILSADVDDNLLSVLGPYTNNLISLPEVNETHLLAALHCKLNTICGENTHVNLVKLTDNIQGLSYSYFQEDKDIYPELPFEQADWLGEFPYWDTPWWNRNDITTLDRSADTQEEYDEWQKALTESEMELANTALFDEIEATVRAAAEGISSASSGELIEVDFEQKRPWKPTLV